MTEVNGDTLTVAFERHEACGDCHACMHGSESCANVDKADAAENFDESADDHNLSQHGKCFRRNVVDLRHQWNDRQNKQTGGSPAERDDVLKQTNRSVQFIPFSFPN